MATKKYQITQLQQDNSLLVLHPETDADIVGVVKGSNSYPGTADNVQDALEELYDMAQNGGVVGVKGDAEASYRQGNVNITKANIGLGNVTNNAQVKGLASGTTENHIVTFGSDGYSIKDSGLVASTSAPSSSSTDTQIPTAKAVWKAINDMPEPMVFKGTLGVNGTIQSLPNASSSNEGYTYKVLTGGNYVGISCKVGDIVVSNGSEWVVIPAGDDVEDTWRAIKVNGTQLLGNGISTGAINLKNGGNVTVNGNGNDITLGVASGYSIPSNTKQNGWDAKYNLPSGGIPKTDLASSVQTSLGKANTALQSNQTITISGDASGSGKTSISLTLANTGVSSGTYSTVTVNGKGLVTAGAQIVEVGTTSQTTPSASLAVGGLFFKEL